MITEFDYCSNGRLDPWSGGGVINTTNPALHTILIHDGAHHLDLRSSNLADPQSVILARKQEVAIITRWITSYRSNVCLETLFDTI